MDHASDSANLDDNLARGEPFRNVSSTTARAMRDPRQGIHGIVHNFARILGVIRPELLWIISILIISVIAHAVNMLQFPYYDNDEGVYMSQAWAVVKLGRLAPYTYWYDHAPFGWLLIALWTTLTGGFYTFGTSIASGRVLMLVIQVISTFFVYRIARRASKSVLAASIAALSFALSPYGIYFHRRVLLDNIAVVWILVSIDVLLTKSFRLTRVWWSAVAMALAVLSKEIAVIVVPSILYLVFVLSDRMHRLFATVGWLITMVSIASGYLLFAVLKGELFPSGSFLGGTSPHVSLLGTLAAQAARGKDGGLFDFGRQFWKFALEWSNNDPMLVVGGTLSCFILLFYARKRPELGFLGVACLSLWLFLARGGLVIGFYFLPLLPLLSICLGIAVSFFTRIFEDLAYFSSKRRPSIIVRPIIACICLSGTLAAYTGSGLWLYQFGPSTFWQSRPAEAQVRALDWVEANMSPDSRIVVDQYIQTDLVDASSRHRPFTKAHSYWKVGLDPEILNGVFGGDWRNIDAIIVTPQLRQDAESLRMPLVLDALNHSIEVAHFDTGGWPVEIRKVVRDDRVTLRR